MALYACIIVTIIGSSLGILYLYYISTEFTSTMVEMLFIQLFIAGVAFIMYHLYLALDSAY